jgi:hypothetical protein
MNKINVGVFPAGTEIGLEINRALRSVKDINLVGISGPVDHSSYVYKTVKTGAPYVGDAGLLSFLKSLIIEYEIEFIFPAHDDACLFLARHEKELNATVVGSSLDVAQICRYKSKTYRALDGEDFLPQVYTEIHLNELPMPVFVKPDQGQGSKGAQLVKDISDLQSLSDPDSYVICEYLPGKEYTIDCFSEVSSRLLSAELRQRERIKSGISVASSNLEIPDEVKNIAQTISSRIGLIGAWFFQLKEDVTGKLKLMEVGCRIAGTMGMYRNRGINYPLASLYLARGYNVSLIQNNFDLSVDRALISRYKTNLDYKAVYIDFDDTIIFGKKVNTDALKFLYQCKNENLEIFLITRHENNVEETLSKFMIPSRLFSKIIHLQSGEKKSDFISIDQAIFIDDSFAERKEVSENLGIPVFDVDAIEMLITWVE